MSSFEEILEARAGERDKFNPERLDLLKHVRKVLCILDRWTSDNFIPPDLAPKYSIGRYRVLFERLKTSVPREKLMDSLMHVAPENDSCAFYPQLLAGLDINSLAVANLVMYLSVPEIDVGELSLFKFTAEDTKSFVNMWTNELCVLELKHIKEQLETFVS